MSPLPRVNATILGLRITCLLNSLKECKGERQIKRLFRNYMEDMEKMCFGDEKLQEDLTDLLDMCHTYYLVSCYSAAVETLSEMQKRINTYYMGTFYITNRINNILNNDLNAKDLGTITELPNLAMMMIAQNLLVDI